MIITLTTDLGTRDFYSGVVKGELLKAIPEARIIDISHDIEPYNIIHGAFVLKNSYHHFPSNTIHLISVNPFHDAAAIPIVIIHENYFFIGQDNGLFGLMWDDVIPAEVYNIHLTAIEKASTLPLRDVYVRAAAHIAAGKEPGEIGSKISTYRKMLRGKPHIAADFIKGSIEYFDHFGNAMVNIKREEFEKVCGERNFLLFFKRYDDLEQIAVHYGSVEESEKLCFFNSEGYLEIAINKGNARSLLNLSVGDFVQIEFQNRT